MDRAKPFILLTGATGYVGGRLLALLQQEDYPVRCMVRDRRRFRHEITDRTEVVEGDVFEEASLRRALEGVDVAYYLIHSMSAPRDFARADREGASRFARVARGAGLKRIVYLGGLAQPEAGLSAHMESRQEVGRILRESEVPVTEFRASVVIGRGSLSFELVRALVERLPVMITPRWVKVVAQPIAIADVLRYLREALDLPAGEHHIFEIGGRDRVSYAGIMREYARLRGLRRVMVPVPVLTPRLSSLWLGLVTPLYARVGRILIQSIRHASVVEDESARRLFPWEPASLEASIKSALGEEDRAMASTHWADALSATAQEREWGGVRFGNRLLDARCLGAGVCASRVWTALARIGGRRGWYYGNWLWRLRGWMDLLAGGVGMKRGRRRAEWVAMGDVIDCWRVEHVEEGRKLRLRAEMKLPGRAWLTFEVKPESHGGGCELWQTAEFDPAGLLGLTYWYLLFPVHQLMFAGMLRGIVRAAEDSEV